MTEATRPRAQAALWVAVLGPALVWSAAFGADYALVAVACAAGTVLPLHLVRLAALPLSLACGALAWREWRRVGVEPPGEGGSEADRTRFMSAVGLMGSAFFSLTIVAQWVTKLVLDPCMGI